MKNKIQGKIACKLKKYGVTIALIFCMLLFVGGATAGILALIGAFGPSDADILELFSQIPDRAGWSSVDEQTGRGELLAAFAEQGGSVDVRVSDVDGYDWEYERMYDVENAKTGSTIAVSEGEKEYSLIQCSDEDEMWIALPNLFKGKVFHVKNADGKDVSVSKDAASGSSVTASGVAAAEKSANDLEVIRALKTVIQDGLSDLSGGIEVTDAERDLLKNDENRGYCISVDKDSVNDILKNAAEVLGAQEYDSYKRAGEWLERLHVPTDAIVYLFAHKDTLTRAELVLTTNRSVYRFFMKFSGAKGDSSVAFRLSGKNNERPFSMTLDKTDKKKSGYSQTEYRLQLNVNKKKICSLQASERIKSADSSYRFRGTFEWEKTDKKYNLKADGSIKDLKMGSCVSYVLDDVRLDNGRDTIMATAVQISLDADGGTLQLPQGDIIELESDIMGRQMLNYYDKLKQNARQRLKNISMDILSGQMEK